MVKKQNVDKIKLFMGLEGILVAVVVEILLGAMRKVLVGGVGLGFIIFCRLEKSSSSLKIS